MAKVRASTPKHVVVSCFGNEVSDHVSKTDAAAIARALNKDCKPGFECRVESVRDREARAARRIGAAIQLLFAR